MSERRLGHKVFVHERTTKLEQVVPVGPGTTQPVNYTNRPEVTGRGNYRREPGSYFILFLLLYCILCFTKNGFLLVTLIRRRNDLFLFHLF